MTRIGGFFDLGAVESRQEERESVKAGEGGGYRLDALNEIDQERGGSAVFTYTHDKEGRLAGFLLTEVVSWAATVPGGIVQLRGGWRVQLGERDFERFLAGMNEIWGREGA